jgi:hypothetical protein
MSLSMCLGAADVWAGRIVFDPAFPSDQPYWVTLRAVDEAGNASDYVFDELQYRCGA